MTTPADDLGAPERWLPPRLAERVRVVRGGPAGAAGGPVLYWMRTAVRGHENPALDAALWAGERLGVPVLVYHAVSERYPYASDRHHRFVLEGARDVADELERRGIGYALHVERPGQRGPHLKTLAARASLVVTEQMPVPPLTRWTAVLAEVGTPLWEVDAACVVPMPLLARLRPGAVQRAFQFRDATRALLKERLSAPWPEVEVRGPRFVPALPFEPVDPRTADLSALIASACIDHLVAPVPDTPGGSKAGYARWSAFRDKRLCAYARTRNDAAVDGVSRMSAYLHYGQVSPLRLAREAAAVGGEGAEKWLDELLVWREMAYHWCAQQADPGGWDRLPEWARQTLHQHALDPRARLLSWEELARARSGEPLWDLAQRSLLVHGELHNNVRMTWGKALVQWTASPAAALTQLIDLNHRYALDGRDPASYLGLLWCLGGFDRPFEPAQPVLGAVRPRPVAEHAGRMDMGAYAARVGRPRGFARPRTVVVGGGVAGAICARTLYDHGAEVLVLDKGRGPGGRLSTRRGEVVSWDHGCPAFTARTGLFRRYLRSWAEQGVVARWEGVHGVITQGRFAPLSEPAPWVGAPGMSGLVRHLLHDVPVRFGAQVVSVSGGAGGWELGLEGGERLLADRVVVATPAAQAVALLPPSLAAEVGRVRVGPVWVVLVRFGEAVELGWESARVEDPVLAWAGRQGGKPGRSGAEAWVLHATTAWSAASVEAAPHEVARVLVEAFVRCVGVVVAPVEAVAHRWRYGRVREAIEATAVWERGIGWCGDGAGGEGVEAAWLSGAAMAGRLLEVGRGA